MACMRHMFPPDREADPEAGNIPGGGKSYMNMKEGVPPVRSSFEKENTPKEKRSKKENAK